MYGEHREKTISHLKRLLKTIKIICSKLPLLCQNAWYKCQPSHMNESEYSDFTPKKEAGRTEEYFRALELALSDSNVKNIALTGPYGAGKSSVIYSFIDQHPASTYLNISLAAFAEKVTKKKKNNEQNNSQETEDNPKLERVNENDDWSLIDVDEEDLEKGILKQLFYKVNYRRIPQSRYRKIHKHGKLSFFGIILTIACLAVGMSWLLGYNYVVNIYEKAAYRFFDIGIGKATANFFIMIIAIAIIYGVSYIFWLLFTRVHLGSVKFADKVEMTSQTEDKESIFNKNLDEIIYFFESTSYDVVFIEDLDRFKNNEVFIKLRELNALLNSYEMIKRRIVFVYAVRDDMFVDTDRTKFFDFIIPIIPYINSTNSGEIMRELLEIDNATSERKCPEHEVSDKFITLTSPYICDMRVLTSIINEFWIYKKTIMKNQGLKSLRDENMLALMVFKNMYPLEFSMIESESGSIKQAFKDKKDFIDGKVKEKKTDLKSKNDTLDDLHRDVLRNASEIKAAFLGYLVNISQ